MNDANNIKATIADKIHQAVSSLLDTEQRLNIELNEARALLQHREGHISGLQQQLENEQKARQRLEEIITEVAKLVNP